MLVKWSIKLQHFPRPKRVEDYNIEVSRYWSNPGICTGWASKDYSNRDEDGTTIHQPTHVGFSEEELIEDVIKYVAEVKEEWDLMAKSRDKHRYPQASNEVLKVWF